MKKLNVFSDRHHNSLYNSLRLLFEDRLGGSLFTQVGLEWYEEKFWNIFDHPATANQYLSLDQRYKPVDGSRQLNQIVGDNPDYYELFDPEYGITQKALTLEQFKNTDIDIIIVSIPSHIEPFTKLRNLYKPNAKLIYQVGNSWDINSMPIPNIMASAKVYIPPKYHSIIYHQEFDTKVFKPDHLYYMSATPKLVMPAKNIYSFVNCFNTQDHFIFDWQLFEEMETLMRDWSFRSFGGQCRDGVVNGSDALSAKMSEARFIWHTKYGGDGYGHVLHNSAAKGRPLIIKEEYYLGKLGGELIKDGETCITIDRLTPQEIMNKIEYFNEPELYRKLCKNTYENFKQKVDFDKEGEAIKIFIDNLM